MGNPQNSRASDDLHAAARSGDLNAVQAILTTNPLAINSRDKHSRTPLHLAAWSGQAEVVNYLCKHKADVGAAAMDDMGAIHFAVQKGHLDIVRSLLSAGASVKASTRKGMTALHYAVQGSHLELVKYLLKKGANLGARTRAGKTPLDLATSKEICSFLEERERLGKNGESSNKEKDEEKEKAEEGDSNKSTTGPEDNSGVESPPVVEEVNSEGNKRKGNEDDAIEVLSQPKKAKVKLSHLQSTDDTQEEDEL